MQLHALHVQLRLTFRESQWHSKERNHKEQGPTSNIAVLGYTKCTLCQPLAGWLAFWSLGLYLLGSNLGLFQVVRNPH